MLISNSVFSQEFERVIDYPLTVLFKPNAAFLIDNDRLYITNAAGGAIYDENLNIIGNIDIDPKLEITDLWYATPIDGLTLRSGYNLPDYFRRQGITQTLFNDDEYYEAVKVTEDTVYIWRLESRIKDERGYYNQVSPEIIQTILPPEGYKFHNKYRQTFIYSTNVANYIAIPTDNEYVYIYYKINKKGATPINRGALISSKASEIKYYDMSGKILDNPVKGINIVKYEDGTIKKKVYK